MDIKFSRKFLKAVIFYRKKSFFQTEGHGNQNYLGGCLSCFIVFVRNSAIRNTCPNIISLQLFLYNQGGNLPAFQYFLGANCLTNRKRKNFSAHTFSTWIILVTYSGSQFAPQSFYCYVNCWEIIVSAWQRLLVNYGMKGGAITTT